MCVCSANTTVKEDDVGGCGGDCGGGGCGGDGGGGGCGCDGGGGATIGLFALRRKT